jgi:hypothetical protein
METKIKDLEQELLVKQKVLHVIEEMKKTRRPPVTLLQEIHALKLALKQLKQQKVKSDKKRFAFPEPSVF